MTPRKKRVRYTLNEIHKKLNIVKTQTSFLTAKAPKLVKPAHKSYIQVILNNHHKPYNRQQFKTSCTQ